MDGRALTGDRASGAAGGNITGRRRSAVASSAVLAALRRCRRPPSVPREIRGSGHVVLGAQAGPKRLAEVFRKAGFSHFRRAAETPFNLIFEVRR